MPLEVSHKEYLSIVIVPLIAITGIAFNIIFRLLLAWHGLQVEALLIKESPSRALWELLDKWRLPPGRRLAGLSCAVACIIGAASNPLWWRFVETSAFTVDKLKLAHAQPTNQSTIQGELVVPVTFDLDVPKQLEARAGFLLSGNNETLYLGDAVPTFTPNGSGVTLVNSMVVGGIYGNQTFWNGTIAPDNFTYKDIPKGSMDDQFWVFAKAPEASNSTEEIWFDASIFSRQPIFKLKPWSYGEGEGTIIFSAIMSRKSVTFAYGLIVQPLYSMNEDQRLNAGDRWYTVSAQKCFCNTTTSWSSPVGSRAAEAVRRTSRIADQHPGRLMQSSFAVDGYKILIIMSGSATAEARKCVIILSQAASRPKEIASAESPTANNIGQRDTLFHTTAYHVVGDHNMTCSEPLVICANVSQSFAKVLNNVVSDQTSIIVPELIVRYSPSYAFLGLAGAMVCLWIAGKFLESKFIPLYQQSVTLSWICEQDGKHSHGKILGVLNGTWEHILRRFSRRRALTIPIERLQEDYLVDPLEFGPVSNEHLGWKKGVSYQPVWWHDDLRQYPERFKKTMTSHMQQV